MSRFDIYQTRQQQLVVDCQADLLDYLSTRFVVPLIEPDSGLHVVTRLNPMFDVQGEKRIFFTQYATTMPVSEIGRRIGSLGHEHYRIMAALDVLISGF